MENRKPRRVTQKRSLTPDKIAKGVEGRRRAEQESRRPPRADEARSESIADVLKQAISSSDRSIQEIAMESTASEGAIMRFLSGEKDIRLATADRLVRVLNLRLTVGR
jgi:ribosome-binding protein aMBF1 (putative translation factor)